MTKKILVIASSLLFIVGCESELDRCVEASKIKFSLPEYDDDAPPEMLKKAMNHPLVLEVTEKVDKEMMKRRKTCEEYDSDDQPESCNDRMDQIYDMERTEWNKAVAIINSEEATEISAKAREHCNDQGIY